MKVFIQRTSIGAGGGTQQTQLHPLHQHKTDFHKEDFCTECLHLPLKTQTLLLSGVYQKFFSYTLSTLLLEYIDPAEALGQLFQ